MESLCNGKTTAAQRKVRSGLAIILFSMGVGTIDRRHEGSIQDYGRLFIQPRQKICRTKSRQYTYATTRLRGRAVPNVLFHSRSAKCATVAVEGPVSRKSQLHRVTHKSVKVTPMHKVRAWSIDLPIVVKRDPNSCEGT